VATYITTVSASRCLSSSDELRVVVGLGQVHAQVVQHRGELLELFRRRPLGAFDRAEARLDELAVLVVGMVVARHADDAAVRRQAAVAECLEQRGHQLAPCEVAGAAEQNEIEAHEKTFLCLDARQAAGPECSRDGTCTNSRNLYESYAAMWPQGLFFCRGGDTQ
jgi:hypothetical protein